MNELRAEGLTGTERIVDNKLIISFNGVIDHYSTHHASKFIKACIEHNSPDIARHIVIDLQSVNYVSSTGVGSLVEIIKILNNAKNGQKLWLFRVMPKVYDVLQLLGFTQFFNFAYELKDIPSSGEVVKPKFPKVIQCVICNKKYKISKPGKYRCAHCKQILVVDKLGDVLI